MVDVLLCSTLRSCVHEVFSRFGTVSPGLGDNYASKCGSGIFPHTKCMSRCVENSQFLNFQTFSPGLEKNEATKCGSENFPRTVTYILCEEKCQNHILMHSCLPIPGRPFQNVKKLHGLRISEWNLYIAKFNTIFFHLTNNKESQAPLVLNMVLRRTATMKPVKYHYLPLVSPYSKWFWIN